MGDFQLRLWFEKNGRVLFLGGEIDPAERSTAMGMNYLRFWDHHGYPYGDQHFCWSFEMDNLLAGWW